jgi:hypothetical protein
MVQKNYGLCMSGHKDTFKISVMSVLMFMKQSLGWENMLYIKYVRVQGSK